MPYVEREGGRIVALTGKRPGVAEEFLPETDPEVIAFRDPPPPLPETTPTTIGDLERALLAKGVVLPADVDDAKRNRT